MSSGSSRMSSVSRPAGKLRSDLAPTSALVRTAGMKPPEGPEGATALSGSPSRTPPARSISSPRVEPISTSKTPGCRTSPQTEKNRRPAAPGFSFGGVPRASLAAGVRVPLAAVEHDRGDPGERLDVGEQGGLVEEAVGLELGRAVARLGPVLLDRLDQGPLLSADIAARADEDLHVERQAGAEAVRAEDAAIASDGKGLVHGVDLVVIFVANVDVSVLRPNEKGGQNHPLDDQVGRAQQKLAVLERRRLALVGVADDKLLVAPGLEHVSPFLRGRSARAAHAAQVGLFELGDQALANGQPVVRRCRQP